MQWLLGAIAAAVIAVPITAALSGQSVPHKGLFKALTAAVPLWVVIVVALIGLLALLVGRASGQHAASELASDLEVLRSQYAEARQLMRGLQTRADRLDARAEEVVVYVRALLDVFGHLDRLFGGPPFAERRTIEKAILEPLAGVFTQQRQAMFKMAVLDVTDETPFEYTMTAHANWGVEADQFKWSKADPLENLGFETQESVMAAPILREGRSDAMLVVMAPVELLPEDREFVAMAAAAVGLVRAAARRNP
jgi:hypothetical protein